MRLFYNIGIRLYHLAAMIISPWNAKAKKWVKGRRGWREGLQNAFQADDRVVWMHCASLGEFEQGRPVIEALKKQCPEYRILLTFFSPSGYEKRKDFPLADHVMYLPLDTARNAKRLLGSVQIEKAIFIKYEFWFHFLKRLKNEGVPVYLASGIFRPGQIFFRWYGGWYQKFLAGFTHIFVQQEGSRQLLEKHGFTRVSVAGDTRFDRVKQLVTTPYENRKLEEFVKGAKVIVAGSTWEPDEELLGLAYHDLPMETRWIIAPHELSASHLRGLKQRFPESILFSELDQGIPAGTRVVIVDTIGHLSYLYRFGSLAYIGGGFGKGIHNILEAATYGLPVFFGPNHSKFFEAMELIKLGGAFPVSGKGQLLSTVRQQLQNDKLLKTTARIASNYVRERVGATNIILQKLCKKSGSNML